MPAWNENGERVPDWDNAPEFSNGRQLFEWTKREVDAAKRAEVADTQYAAQQPYLAAEHRQAQQQTEATRAEADRAYWQQLQQQAAAGSREAQIAVAFAERGRQGLLSEQLRDVNGLDGVFDAKAADRILKQGSLTAAFKAARDIGRQMDHEQAQRRARPTTHARSMQDVFHAEAAKAGYVPREDF